MAAPPSSTRRLPSCATASQQPNAAAHRPSPSTALDPDGRRSPRDRVRRRRALSCSQNQEPSEGRMTDRWIVGYGDDFIQRVHDRYGPEAAEQLQRVADRHGITDDLRALIDTSGADLEAAMRAFDALRDPNTGGKCHPRPLPA